MAADYRCRLMALRIALDLRPRGPERWARAFGEALVAAAPEHAWLTDEWKTADVVLALGGGRPRFGPPAWTAVHDIRPSWTTAWITRQSDRLLAPSETVAHALRGYFRVPERRLVRLPPVLPGGFRRAQRAEVERFQQRHDLDGAWVVVLGEVPPGLSGQRLIRAAALPEGELRAALSGAVAAVDADPRAGNASAVLEAMACGAPAVVAPGSAGAEVIGSAGILVSPQDASGWAAALAFPAGNREERNRMAARALRAAAQFRAADAARRLLEALTEAARADRRAAGAG